MGTYSRAIEEFEILRRSTQGKNKDDWPIALEYEEEILALVSKFGDSGQSGASAPMVASLLVRTIELLCLHKPLLPLTGDTEEWVDVSEISPCPQFQNRRDSAVFKDTEYADSVYLDAVRFQTSDRYVAFSGTVDEITSRLRVKSFPFTPKTFYLDVEEVMDSTGNSEYHIKDRSQLDAVFAYYDPLP